MNALGSLLHRPEPVQALLAGAHQAFSTRRVPRERLRQLLPGPAHPQAGDLLLAEVTALGQHRNVELCSGRKAGLAVGDRLILAYGNRYAPDQFEALVPDDLGPCDLIAGGGLASREVARHAAMNAPTRLRPLGRLGDGQGRALNLADFALPPLPQPPPAVPVWVVCGTSMNAGKTHTAAMLIRGLRAGGRRVVACKLTGTGAGNDLWKMRDAGAERVLDFADAGYASTYRVPLPGLIAASLRLLDHASAGADAVVAEIADGLGQAETAGLLRSDALRRRLSGVLFAAGDPLGAAAGVRWLREAGLPVRACSGVFTAEAQGREEAAGLIDLPVLRDTELAQPDIAQRLAAVVAR
ncbi:MAG TPA: hypothetical protein VFV27_10745 [Nevskiaceae bacterium]|nr:hypothetical protein [Nevskiaceae bacterium]